MFKDGKFRLVEGDDLQCRDCDGYDDMFYTQAQTLEDLETEPVFCRQCHNVRVEGEPCNERDCSDFGTFTYEAGLLPGCKTCSRSKFVRDNYGKIPEPLDIDKIVDEQRSIIRSIGGHK